MEDGVHVERVDEVEDEVDALEVVPAQRYCGIQTHQEHVTSLALDLVSLNSMPQLQYFAVCV